MDDRSIDRILADMKKAPGSKRANFLRFEDSTFGCVRAKRELRKDIELSIAVCKAAEEIGEPKNVKKIGNALVKIRDQLHGCQQLLEENAAAANRLATACAPDIPNPKSALSAIASGAEDEIERLANLKQFEGDRHTYLATLIGRLENVYEKDFGLSARRTNNIHRSPDPDGTFIRFVEAVLREFGILFRGKPYSRAAIGRALTDVRVGRKRRRAV